MEKFSSKNIEDVDLLLFFTFIEIKNRFKDVGKKITLVQAAEIYAGMHSETGEQVSGIIIMNS